MNNIGVWCAVEWLALFITINVQLFSTRLGCVVFWRGELVAFAVS